MGLFLSGHFILWSRQWTGLPGRAYARLPSKCFLWWLCSSGGNVDLASATALPPDGCSERDLLWSQHIPGWIRTGNQSRNRIWPSLLSLSNPAAPSQRHPQHFLLQLVWPCYIGDTRGLCESQDFTSCSALLPPRFYGEQHWRLEVRIKIAPYKSVNWHRCTKQMDTKLRNRASISCSFSSFPVDVISTLPAPVCLVTQ